MNERYVRSRGIVARTIAGETILVPVTRRAQDMGLLTLNEVGSFVWERLASAQDVDALTRSVCEHFVVSPDEARSDLEPFVAQLHDTGCIEVSA